MSKPCVWVISGSHRHFMQCGQPATHQCPLSGSCFCRHHAEDYMSVFGDETLHELPIEESQP